MPWDSWPANDIDLLRTLALRVRMLTSPQIARGWFRGDSRQCQKTLARLTAAGLLDHLILESHPLLSLDGPLFVWTVGSAAPTRQDFESIAQRARQRWPLPHQPVEVLLATRNTLALFGAFGRFDPKHSEASHDLHFAEVYLHYRLNSPHLASMWLGEAAFPKLGFEISRMKDPDGFLVNGEGVAQRVIEFSGKYEPDHLAEIHVHCAGAAADRLRSEGWCDSDNPFRRLYAHGGTSYELW